jgi:hypothetical protein
MAHKNTLNPLLNRKDAARYLGVSPGTLAVWDCTKQQQLHPVLVGRLVHYQQADLDLFLDQRLKD